jgi:hypothetical protein
MRGAEYTFRFQKKNLRILDSVVAWACVYTRAASPEVRPFNLEPLSQTYPVKQLACRGYSTTPQSRDAPIFDNADGI